MNKLFPLNQWEQIAQSLSHRGSGERHLAALFVLFAALAPSTSVAMAACPADLPLSAWTNCSQEAIFSNGIRFSGEFQNGRPNGQGRFEFANGNVYEGAFVDGLPNGFGSFSYANGNRYVGEWQNERAHGRGLFTFADGRPPLEGIWRRDEFVQSEPIPDHLAGRTATAPVAATGPAKPPKPPKVAQPQQQAERLMSVSVSDPDANGIITLKIDVNSDTASLKINGDEAGGRADGRYAVTRFAQVGDNKFEIIATDRSGNSQKQTLTVRRGVENTVARVQPLNPTRIPESKSQDAVAIIIGIEKYRRAPSADFANNDASVFYDYARRALGVKQENIKLLLDDKADAAEVLRSFKSWLPTRVSAGKTDVYVFYSGHGLPSEDGNSLYFMPHEVDRDYLERTAVTQKEVVSAIERLDPRSVTMFIDSCYSGQSRTGETLLAGARPISVAQRQTAAFPGNFTVISASAPDQISSSSPDLKHGIFSYYLMRGMEGEADSNSDGQITIAEMQGYLVKNVGRRAMGMNRTQQPQVVGDQSRVLVGR